MISSLELSQEFLVFSVMFNDPCNYISGSLPAVKIILEIAGKQSFEHRDKNNRTPLILATMGGHGEVVNFLLAEGGYLSNFCLVLSVCLNNLLHLKKNFLYIMQAL